MGTGRRTEKRKKAEYARVRTGKEGIDYRIYRWKLYEILLYGSISIGITGIFAFLFYRSVYALMAAVFVVPLFLRYQKAEKIKKRRERLLLQFCDGMQAVCAAMQAGYSVENAWIQAEKEMKNLYGEKAEMTRAFVWMNQRVRMHVPMEQAVADFAAGSGLEDIQNFANVFGYARRNGGNMKIIITSTTAKIREKQTVMAEIQTLLAAKKLEQKIMNVMPLAILGYISLTSPDYMEVLYHNGLGYALMSVCLAVYLGAWYWSGKLVNIEV